MSDVPDTINLAQILADIEAHTEIRYPVVYDPQLRAKYAAAQEAVDKAEADLRVAEKRTTDETAYMSEAAPAADTTARDEALVALALAKTDAESHQLVAVFRGQMGKDYVDAVTDAAKIEGGTPVDIWGLYAERAYKRLETLDGAIVAGERDEVLYGLMTTGDLLAAGRQVMQANEAVTQLPF